jgi:hypothetical protein
MSSFLSVIKPSTLISFTNVPNLELSVRTIFALYSISSQFFSSNLINISAWLRETVESDAIWISFNGAFLISTAFKRPILYVLLLKK